MPTGVIDCKEKNAMKKQNFAVPVVLYAITVLLFSACFDPLGPKPEQGAAGANTGRVLISIVGAEDSSAPETEPSAAIARTLLPEFGALTYTVKITSGSNEVFNQTVTATSTAADLAVGTYSVSVEASDSGDALVAQGSGTVSISLGVESPVTIRLVSVESGTGTFEYTVTIPPDPPVKSGVIEFFRLPSGTNPSPIDLTTSLTGTVSAGNASLSAGFYRVVLTVEVLGKKVAKTQIIHIAPNTTTSADFDLSIGDFVPSPPAGGSVVYITNQAELAAIREHIGSAEMNYGKNAYVLLNDIALSGNWTPIGSLNDSLSGSSDWVTAFQGYFFGENHRITGLTFSGESYLYTGLFGVIHKALIQDLTVETAVIPQLELKNGVMHYAGLVAGGVSESDLANITIKPANLTVTNVPSTTIVLFGGAAGSVLNSRLRDINVAGASGSSLSFSLAGSNSSGTNSQIGGIAGSLDSASEISGSAVSLNINRSHPNGSSLQKLGGIAGSNSGTIRQSSYSGTLTISHAGDIPQTETGGIAGYNGGIIEDCYASPEITISTNTTVGLHRLYTGGLAGENKGIIRNSYAACGIEANVTTSSTMKKELYSGGVAGFGSTGEGLIDKCYAIGSLQIAVNSTLYSYDEIYTGGIGGAANDTYSFGTVSSSAALAHTIVSTAPLSGSGASRIIPLGKGTGTITNNIAFSNMFINGVTLPDAVTAPQNDKDGLGKTAAQLASQATYETSLGWDFSGVWEMGPASYPYPILQWQNGTAPVVPQGFEPPEDENFATGIQIGLEEEISLDATALTIYKTGTPASLAITAPAGYDGYRWLVDGKDAGTSQNLSLYAANHPVGAHAITAVLFRGSVPYSKNIVIQVEE
jgi:hypothetical protein